MGFCCRYGVVKGIADSSFVPSKIPNGCTPIHLNLVVNLFFDIVIANFQISICVSTVCVFSVCVSNFN